MTDLERLKEAAEVLADAPRFALRLDARGVVISLRPEGHPGETVNQVVPWAMIEQARFNVILLEARKLEYQHKPRGVA